MEIAVIGAGVNGICCAISIAEKDCKVTVFEAKTPFTETSSKSSRLLHCGIRYLESLYIKPVREALADRAWWLKNAGQYTKTGRFYISVYKNKSRSHLKLYLGAKFYEWLAGQNSLGTSRYHNHEETVALNPALSSEGLLGSVSNIDVQMNDYALSEWLLKRAESIGVVIHSNAPIQRISTDGSIANANGETIKSTKVVNTCGPWAKELVDDSRISSVYSLALVKGSHLFVNRDLKNPIVVQVPEDGRLVFALPYEDKTLIGATELRHWVNCRIV